MRTILAAVDVVQKTRVVTMQPQASPVAQAEQHTAKLANQDCLYYLLVK